MIMPTVSIKESVIGNEVNGKMAIEEPVLTTLCHCIINSQRGEILIEINDKIYSKLDDECLNEFQQCLIIETYNTDSVSSLLERWSITLLNKRHQCISISSMSSLVQAITSFSQITSLSDKTRSLKYKLLHKVSKERFCVTQHERHQFPIAITQSSIVQVIVEHLPQRLNTTEELCKQLKVTKLSSTKPHPSDTPTTKSRQIKLSVGGVRPPGASSPIPSVLCHDKRLKRMSCGSTSSKIVVPKPSPVRSMSLPAVVPNMCLLGTFEESVLNDRIEPCGYVEGFTADLSASGSFCPEHVQVPVTVSFFHLSDDGGPSPYLGHINLGDISKKGYRIPLQGTVQLTLFNPNKSVVKIFIILYDHSDMPSCTSTFIRQKTISHNSQASPPCLHYLIHLRFFCSASGRLYLHTNIKLIFAIRSHDENLVTLTEGPTDPKYGPIADI